MPGNSKKLKRVVRQLQQEGRTIALQEIVRQLNEGFNKEYPLHAEAHGNLIQLVQAWQQGQQAPLNSFEREHGPRGPHVARQPTLLRMRFPPGCPLWHEIETRCQAYLPPSGTGASSLVVYVGEKGKQWTAWDHALRQFISLITNPEREKLAGPCQRCGKYYVKKRASQKVYCSRTCGNAATAVLRTRKKWDEERGKRLNAAKKAMREWSRLKTTELFQEWAEDRYPDLTKKFLTRAINNRELPKPIKKSN
jgi:hypothetical protein